MRFVQFFLAAAIVSTTSLAVSPAAAVEGSGPSVGGDATINVATGIANNIVDGEGAVGETNIGVVSGNAEVAGDLDINVKATNTNNVVKGDDARGCLNIGLVGRSACQ